MNSSVRWALTCFALGALPAAAVEVGDGKLSINGFGSWSYGASNNGNTFDVAGPDGHFDDGDFALGLSARLSERGVVAAQVHLNVVTGGVVLNFAFGEWRFSDLAHLRIGVVKHPVGIFGEVPLVGTLRPFFLLPASVYGTTEMTGSGVSGLSLSGSVPTGGWRLSYDLYGGALTVRDSNVVDKVADPGIIHPGGVLETTSEQIEYMVGGRAIFSTPLEGLDLRLSAYGRPITDTKGARGVIGPSLQYLGEKLSVRAEYFFLYEQGPTEHDKQRTHGAYLEAAYFVTEQIQLGARAEIFQLNLVGLRATPLVQHRELAGTFNYWLDPGLVLKLSAHLIDGNRFANPLAYDDAVLAGNMSRTTFATIFGTQFSF